MVKCNKVVKHFRDYAREVIFLCFMISLWQHWLYSNDLVSFCSSARYDKLDIHFVTAYLYLLWIQFRHLYSVWIRPWFGLDYGNSLFAGCTNAQFNKLQRIQNRAARLICGAKRREHISPYLARLHWLPVRQRFNFKLLVYIARLQVFDS